MNHRRRHHAFTLLELILAMAMVAMLSLTLYATFNVAWKAKRRAEATVRPTRTIAIAIDMITRDLDSMVPPNPQSATTANLYLAGPFVGEQDGGVGSEADWVEFCCLGSDATGINVGSGTGLGTGVAAPTDDNPTAEGIRRVDWGLRTDVTPSVLVRRVTRNLLAPTDVDPEEQVICRNVKSFSVKYFDGQDWYEDWDSTQQQDNAIPLLVQVDLVINQEPTPQQQRTGQDPGTYHVNKVIPIPCAKPIATQ
ncbi:MAG TPA: type II secretion system protein GspJ [Tepidisphaeraceae bacterium]|jgi:type II secretion system protein J